MLLQFQGSPLAIVGAVIMLAALAFEPFIQQAISTPLVVVRSNGTASVPTSQNY